MGYQDEKRARDRAFIELLHTGPNGETGECLPPIVITTRRQHPPPVLYDEDLEPGWKAAAVLPASALFPSVSE